MGSEERELEDILRIKKRRLSQLDKQIARFGYSAPPEVVTERDELREEVARSQKAIDPIVKGELPDDIMAALRAYGVPASVNNALQLVEAALYELRKSLADHRVELHDMKDKVTAMVADVQDLKKDTDEGKSGRRRNFKLQMASIALSAIVLVAILLFFR